MRANVQSSEQDENMGQFGKSMMFQSRYIYTRWVKRSLDVVVSAVGLGVLLIPMVVIAIIIRVTSDGPIIFSQLRAGVGGKMFVAYKFRSMVVGAPEKANKDFESTEMSRYITKFGSFMRKTSIDEIPQLLNVLRGEMSIIGPRPLARTDENVLRMRQKSGADQVRPGITGLAQVHGRNLVSDVEKATWDGKYAKEVSWWLDFRILIKSVVVVLTQVGINKR